MTNTRIRTQVMRARDFYQKPEYVKKANRLALPSKQGAMRDMIKSEAPGNVVLAWEGTNLLGWAYLNRETHDTSFQTHVYVRSTRRGEGIGEKILNKARSFARKQKRGLYGRPWDSCGYNLFQKVGINCNTVDSSSFAN